jgi:hypothetical protein
VVVTGLEGAAVGGVTVLVEDLASGKMASGPVSAGGSFAVVIAAAAGEVLALRLRAEESPLTVTTPPADGPPAPEARASEVDSAGSATVSGTAPSGDTIIVTRPKGGEVVTTRAAAGGTFETKIRAQAGEALFVFALDPGAAPSQHRGLLVPTGAAPPPACIDSDGDGYGAIGTDRTACSASTTLADCDDSAREVRPGQGQFFATAIAGAPPGAAFDYNCDGREEAEFPALADCTSQQACTGGGFQTAVPACGEQGTWVQCVLQKTICTPVVQGAKVQACR